MLEVDWKEVNIWTCDFDDVIVHPVYWAAGSKGKGFAPRVGTELSMMDILQAERLHPYKTARMFWRSGGF